MAVYAAMIDRLDQSIGRVLDSLKRLDQHDNTLILFLSDNGGCAEFMAEDGWAKFMPDIHNDGRKITMGNRSDIRPGDPLTYMSYDLPWANVSNAPFRLFKHWVHEGGISTPMIVQWPERIKKPAVLHSSCHVIDIMPTILEAAGIIYPKEFKGKAIQDLDGESLLSLFMTLNWEREQPLYWEHEGNAAVRLGNFKLVRKFNEPWELYDMEADRTELNNLIKLNDSMVKNLLKEYEQWASVVGVKDWNKVLPQLLSLWQMKDAHG